MSNFSVQTIRTSGEYAQFDYPYEVLIPPQINQFTLDPKFISAATLITQLQVAELQKMYPFTYIAEGYPDLALMGVTDGFTRMLLTHPKLDKAILKSLWPNNPNHLDESLLYEDLFKGRSALAEDFFRSIGLPGAPIYWGASLLIRDRNEGDILTVKKGTNGHPASQVYDANMIGLPGGKTDIIDFLQKGRGVNVSLQSVLTATALREAKEEIGFDLEQMGRNRSQIPRVKFFFDERRNKGQAFVFVDLDDSIKLLLPDMTAESTQIMFTPTNTLQSQNVSPELTYALSLLDQ